MPSSSTPSSLPALQANLLITIKITAAARDGALLLTLSARFSNSLLQIQPRSRPARPDRPPCLPGTLLLMIIQGLVICSNVPAGEGQSHPHHLTAPASSCSSHSGGHKDGEPLGTAGGPPTPCGFGHCAPPPPVALSSVHHPCSLALYPAGGPRGQDHHHQEVCWDGVALFVPRVSSLPAAQGLTFGTKPRAGPRPFLLLRRRRQKDQEIPNHQLTWQSQ